MGLCVLQKKVSNVFFLNVYFKVQLTNTDLEHLVDQRFKKDTRSEDSGCHQEALNTLLSFAVCFDPGLSYSSMRAHAQTRSWPNGFFL